MTKEKQVNSMLTNEQITRVKNFLLETLDSTDENGEPDLEKIIRNATYNMGEGAAQIGGLLFQEQLKLDDLEKQLRETKLSVQNDVLTTRLSYTPTNENVRTMVDGDPTVSALTSKVNRQKLYIQFLKDAQEQIRYYPKNAKALVEVATYGREYGKIIGK